MDHGQIAVGSPAEQLFPGKAHHLTEVVAGIYETGRAGEYILMETAYTAASICSASPNLLFIRAPLNGIYIRLYHIQGLGTIARRQKACGRRVLCAEASVVQQLVPPDARRRCLPAQAGRSTVRSAGG